MFGTPGHGALHRSAVRPRSRWWLPLVIAALVAATGGVAEAYWTSAGPAPGHGSGTSGTTQTLVLSPGVPSRSLQPGGTADVVLTISNPNPEIVQLASIDLDPTRAASGFAVDAAHASCDTRVLAHSSRTTGWTIPARSDSVDGTSTVVLADALSMAGDAADSCQGAEFEVHLVASS